MTDQDIETFFAILIVRIDHNEWSINHFLRCKHSLPGSPRFCTAFRKFSRNIVDILEGVVHGHITLSLTKE